MTEQEQTDAEFIAAVKPVCEAATEGPWYSRGMGGDSYLLADAQPGAHKVERVFDMFPLAWPRHYLDMDDKRRTDGTAGMRHDDARFCALARQALPEALERLEEADRRSTMHKKSNQLATRLGRESRARAEAAEAEAGRQKANALNDQERANDMERERDEMQRVHDAGLKILKGSTEALTEVAQERDELREQLRPGSPTERAPTQWAYDRACEARENWRVQALAAERERDELRTEVADLRSRLDWLDRTVNPVTDRNTMP